MILSLRVVILTIILNFAVGTSLEPLNFHYLPGLNEQMYSQIGDINIGGMTYVLQTSKSHPAESCSTDVVLQTCELENTESIAFAVNWVNQNPHILPNVSMGFVIRGICQNAGAALGTSLSFLPRSHRECNDSTCSIQASRSMDSPWLSHDVIAMVGTGLSGYGLPISSLFAVGRLPMVGPTETNDEFSNKRKHPYFFRMVAPDKYQVQAMLKFVASKGWSYISVVYDDGAYGMQAFDRINQNADRYGICVATSHRLIQPPDYSQVVSDLLLNHRARVVIVFLTPTSFRHILQAVVDHNATGHFIWIASDYMVFYAGYQYQGIDYDPAVGTFTFSLPTSFVPPFFEHLKELRFSNMPNPWMRPVWEWVFDCSHAEGTCDPDANVLQSPKYQTFKESSLRIDAVIAIARAAHNLLASKCPNARGKEARACITGELLREYLKDTNFDGFNGPVEFDENQDIKGRYIISQIVHEDFRFPFLDGTEIPPKKLVMGKRIGHYEVATESLHYYNETMTWSHLTSLDRFMNWTEKLIPSEVPQSKCSVPCEEGEFRIEKELPCCWECRKCRDNERLIDDNTTCEACPSFMWPDPTTGFTTCVDIPLTYPMVQDPIPIVFTSLAIIALVIVMIIIVMYFKYREERVIKASSRELSVIQLFAIFIGYTTIILFQTKPTDTMCGIIFFLFCMSFALLYCPLLVKTVRITRIFRSGAKNQKPRFISPASQMVFTIILIIAQVAICVTIFILYWPGARRTQPIWSEKLVELSCDLTFPGIVSFLGYNIVLVSLCSVFAFMVRSLPDNFNESKFISMCVTTTLLIFLAFIPAYFTADREYIRVFLLSVALILNHSVALIFLFIPKIYAARFLPSEAGDFSKGRS